jgi:DNA-binding TFAR19-related protein (PDSD5 family)
VRRLVLTLFVPLLVTVAAQDRPLPDFNAFTAQVKSHLATDQERQSGYMFIEKRTEQTLDGSGGIKDQTVSVFEVYPGLPGQERYRRLIEEHGKPVPAATLTKNDRKRQEEVEAYARKISTSQERQKETQQREKERQQYRAAIDDLFRLYDIRLVRREPIEGHDAILATLTPKPGVKPQTDDGQMMQHFKARAWVSESDYELVRAEIEALDDLSFGWGLLARVHKGTTATYQRRKVNN